MATTPTNKPIPSEDPRDLKFNAGKIDEEVNGSADYYTDRFSVQRLTNTGRNNKFQDAQTQREYDFQQFLLNSGYQFLGDYENGPYTITARNQIIRYQNEFWRLNAATNPPYTTTGVNSTSWANDITHLVSVGDAALRQELASPTGATLVSLSQGGTVQDAIKVVTPEMFPLAANDTARLNAAFAAAGTGAVELDPSKVYQVTGALTLGNCTEIRGNGATIKLTTPTPPAGLTMIRMGWSLGSLSGLSIAVSANQKTVTIPGISAIASVGDMVSMASTDLRLTAPESNYLHGMRAVILSMSGDSVTLNTGFYAAFTITSVTVHYGRKGLSVSDLTLDMTVVGSSTTNLIEGISLTGVNMRVDNCKIIGSQYCSAGLVIQGCVGDVKGCFISGFVNTNGVPSGGQTGYGVYDDCNNFAVDNTTFANCKHCYTSASRQYVKKGVSVANCNADSTGVSNAQAVFDLHANIVGLPSFDNNTISAGKAAFGFRNGSARVTGGKIISRREADTTPALIGVDEFPTISRLEISGVVLDCSSNMRMFSFGELTAVNNLIVDGVTGTIGSIIDQAMNLSSISDMSIRNNNISGMTKIINANRRSSASTQTMFSQFIRARIENNFFDCSNDDLSTFTIAIWSHANNAVANKLQVTDFRMSDNIILAADTPMVFDFVALKGVTEISRNTLRHPVTSGTVTPPTQSSIAFNNTPADDLTLSGNRMSGRYRFTVAASQAISGSAVAYPTENVSLKVDVNSSHGLGVTFESTVNSIDYRITFADSRISNNLFIGTYGTTIGFTTAYNPTGWNSGGVVDISGNTLRPLSGNSVGIGLGWGTHSIVITNNRISAAISDSSTPAVAPSNNTTIPA